MAKDWLSVFRCIQQFYSYMVESSLCWWKRELKIQYIPKKETTNLLQVTRQMLSHTQAHVGPSSRLEPTSTECERQCGFGRIVLARQTPWDGDWWAHLAIGHFSKTANQTPIAAILKKITKFAIQQNLENIRGTCMIEDLQIVIEKYNCSLGPRYCRGSVTRLWWGYEHAVLQK
jgi:hypothetical protein